MLRNTQRVLKKFYSSTPQVTEENINKAGDVAKHFDKFRNFYAASFVALSTAFYIGYQVNEFNKEKELRKQAQDLQQHYQDMLHNHSYGLWSGLLNKDGTDVYPEKLKKKY